MWYCYVHVESVSYFVRVWEIAQSQFVFSRISQIWPSAFFFSFGAVAQKSGEQLHEHSCFCLNIVVTPKIPLDSRSCCHLHKAFLVQSSLKGNI